MKKLLLAIVFWGVISGNVNGQVNGIESSVICPPVYTINSDTTIYLYFDTISSFWSNNCSFWQNAACGENIIRFTAACTNNYLFEMASPGGSWWFPVSYKISSLTYCDSIGYSCLTPFSSVWDNQSQLYYDKFYIPVSTGVTYDILVDYACANPSADPPQTLIFLLSKPHVFNVQFYNITPDSISVSWDGTFDDMVIEYGPKDFSPGSDTVAGVNGIIIHNPSSPYTFTGLVPDSVYDFYFRDKCGVYSANSSRYRKKTVINCANIPVVACGGGFTFTNYGSSQLFTGSWIMGDHCGCVMTSREGIWSFTPDTNGIFTIFKYSTGSTAPALSLFYKEAILGCNENNWNYIGCGANYHQWARTFGPLTSGTTYYLMVKGNQDTCVSVGISGSSYRLVCPYVCYTPDQPWAYAVTATTVNINSACFLCNGTEILEYGLSGFTPGTDSMPGAGGTVLYGVTGIDTITGLLPSTTYDFYLREYCDTAGVFSDNSVKRTITTLPLCSTAPTGINSNATNNTICAGQSVTLTRVGGVLSQGAAFYWYADSCGGTSLGTGSVKTFYPTDTTTYYVRAEDSCGVTACASVTITVNPLPPPPAITGNTTICQGSNTTLLASGGYTNYQWSNGATTQSIMVNAAGTYTVTVSNSYGCTTTTSTFVTVNPNPVPVISGITSICQGNSTTLNAGAGYACYFWSIGSITQNITVTIPGVYTVTVCDGNGCMGSDSITVTVNPNPVVIITPGGTIPICLGDTVHFIATTGSGYTYTWFKNGLFISGASNSFYDAFANGQYSVTVTDSNGCYSMSPSTQVHVICFPPIDPELRTATVLNDDIILMPNPANNELTVISNESGETVEIKITDTMGRLCLRTLNSQLPAKIDISSFPNGIYFVTVDGNENVVKKFIKN